MSFEGILMWALAIAAALGGGMLVVALRGAVASEIALAAAAGRFVDALEEARQRPPETRDDLLAAAIAAKHRQSFDQAADWLRALLVEDPADGEALVELGLVETYRGRSDEADARLREAAAQRADLGESILLHRAFALLVAGDAARARALFEEVEAPLETKLAIDVGPGEPAFAEWFLHAAALWRDGGNSERAAWAWRQAEDSAPESLLPQQVQRLLSKRHPGIGDGAGGGAR
jgi:tetratricopeptide (TPR) repeat protein